MPKNIDYPRKSFLDALKFAEAVDYLGGNTLVTTVADRLNMSATGGSFHALAGATLKHALIEKSKEYLKITSLFKKIKLAYNEEEKLQALRESFLMPPVYSKIYEKFKNKEFPTQMLDKILIRELNVQEDIASRVANYFIKGTTYCALLINNRLVEVNSTDNDKVADETEMTVSPVNTSVKNKLPFYGGEDLIHTKNFPNDSNSFIVHIYGHGIDSKLLVNDDDDLIIVEATLNKLRKKLKEEKKEGEVSQS
ncbi:MAG TPA: hypothetical protein VK492_15430 [Chitinophagaceae bacterium]|nr:hypothetical protein [Chitinophagaceae bacterium]